MFVALWCLFDLCFIRFMTYDTRLHLTLKSSFLLLYLCLFLRLLQVLCLCLHLLLLQRLLQFHKLLLLQFHKLVLLQ